jgi:hypothetical protein
MDAKKISVSETGLEDLAGLGNTKTNEEEIKVFETSMAHLEALVKQNDRKGVLDVFDSITMMSQQLVNRIVAIEKLIIKNDRQLERNQLLAKYIEKSTFGWWKDCQKYEGIAEPDNCSDC